MNNTNQNKRTRMTVQKGIFVLFCGRLTSA